MRIIKYRQLCKETVVYLNLIAIAEASKLLNPYAINLRVNLQQFEGDYLFFWDTRLTKLNVHL